MRVVPLLLASFLLFSSVSARADEEDEEGPRTRGGAFAGMYFTNSAIVGTTRRYSEHAKFAGGEISSGYQFPNGFAVGGLASMAVNTRGSDFVATRISAEGRHHWGFGESFGMWLGLDAGLSLGQESIGTGSRAPVVGLAWALELYAARVFFVGTGLRVGEVLAQYKYPEAFAGATFGFRVPTSP